MENVQPEVEQRRLDAYQRYRDDLLKRQISNSESYDKAILTLSSAALGLTLTFIDRVVPLRQAECLSLMIAVWVLFATSIVVTLISYHISQIAISTQLANADQYYLHGREEFASKIPRGAFLTELASYFSSLTFLSAVICLVIFVGINLVGKG
ncbi:MAG: hypothetical protein IAG10_24110 [Planctomycetaceae bacterium]|nr:hypothetical protein [Planctomycetaceae bacterium]